MPANSKKDSKSSSSSPTTPTPAFALHLRLQYEDGEVLFYAVHGEDVGRDGEVPCVFQSNREPTDIRGGFVVLAEDAHPVSEEALMSIADTRNNYAHVIEVARTYLVSPDRWKEQGNTSTEEAR